MCGGCGEGLPTAQCKPQSKWVPAVLGSWRGVPVGGGASRVGRAGASYCWESREDRVGKFRSLPYACGCDPDLADFT
jgi:hypothetical protein